MKRIIISIIAAVLMAFVASYGSAGDHGHDENHICFTKVDSNNDDEVTPEELSRFYPDDKTLFEKIDQDKDGLIYHEEYEEYWYSQE